MPRIERKGDEEVEAFNLCVQEIESWWKSSLKQSCIRRPYTAERVAALRSNLKQTYASSDMALKLLRQMQEHDAKGTWEMTFGTTDPVIAAQIAKHSQTIYVSGSLCNSSETYEPGADHADYPWDTVPKVVEKIFRGQQWQDQRQRHYRMLHTKEEREKMDEWDYLTPIVADADMGFGGLTSTIKMTKLFVESGVAMFHLDDLAIGFKKFTTGEKRTVIPLSDYEDRLIAARLQIDIMGAETLICARCDLDDSEYITDITDPRDHQWVQGATVPIEGLEVALRKAAKDGKNINVARKEWIKASGLSTFDEAVEKVASAAQFEAYKTKLGKGTVPLDERRKLAEEILGKPVFFNWDLARSRGGQFFYKSCVEAMIQRAVTVAPLTDVTWGRMDAPKWEKIVAFHEGVRKQVPGRLFLFGYTGQYDFAAAGFTEQMVKEMPEKMAKMGIVWQVQPVWASQGMNMVVDQFAEMWVTEGIAGYVEKCQKPALAMNPMPDGFGKTSYRGAYFADGLFDAIASRDY